MNIIKTYILYFRAGLVFAIAGPILLIIIFIFPKLLYKTIVPWCKLMINMFGCSIITKGKIPSNQTFVIMANHVSFLDVFAIPSVITGKFSGIAASKNFKIPIYSIFLKKLKVISIDRSNREQSIKGVKQAEKLLKEGYHIAILPEGTRTKTGNLGEFKKGGFHLAINTKSSILPIVTKGLFKIKPTTRKTINPDKIFVEVGDPIRSANKTVEELLTETRNIFKEMLK